jgi:hypothetical protein
MSGDETLVAVGGVPDAGVFFASPHLATVSNEVLEKLPALHADAPD